MNSRALRVAIVGAGRVGESLGYLLNNLGNKIETVISRQPARARTIARRLTAKNSIKLGSSFPLPGLLIIATPDDAINDTADLIADTAKDWRGVIVLHCSGALSSKELEPLRKKGAACGSLHPLRSFAAPEKSPVKLAGSYWCIEGDEYAVRLARRIVRGAHGNAVEIDARKKAVYHAAAVMACGHIVALFDLSLEMLAECGIDRATAQAMLLPLTTGTVANLAAGAERALTGPFARKDMKTVAHHLHAMVALKKEFSAIYTLLGRHSLEITKRRSK